MLVQYNAGGKSNRAQAYIRLRQILGGRVTHALRQPPEPSGLFGGQHGGQEVLYSSRSVQERDDPIGPRQNPRGIGPDRGPMLLGFAW